MSSLVEVARRAGVSKATASRALSGAREVAEATRERVVAAAAALGYVPSTSAGSLVTGRTRNVGVVTPYVNRWFFGEVIEGIEEALIAAGYDLTLFLVQGEPTRRQRVFDYFLVRKRVDAVITVVVALAPEEVRMLHSLGRPVVGIGGGVPGMSSLHIDDAAAARLATEHLLSLGHRRLAHFGGDQERQLDFHTPSRRRAGFENAMAQAGLSTGDDIYSSDFTIQAGYALALDVLGNPSTRPTAIVCASDEIAIGVITAARQLGIQVPAQLSVTGIDDHDLAEMYGLTTVVQRPREQGVSAVQLVMSSIESGDTSTAHSIELPVSLRVRSSTSAPPTS